MYCSCDILGAYDNKHQSCFSGQTLAMSLLKTIQKHGNEHSKNIQYIFVIVYSYVHFRNSDHIFSHVRSLYSPHTAHLPRCVSEARSRNYSACHHSPMMRNTTLFKLWSVGWRTISHLNISQRHIIITIMRRKVSHSRDHYAKWVN